MDGLVQVLSQFNLQLLDGRDDQLMKPQMLQSCLAWVEQDFRGSEPFFIDQQLTSIRHDVLTWFGVVFR